MPDLADAVLGGVGAGIEAEDDLVVDAGGHSSVGAQPLVERADVVLLVEARDDHGDAWTAHAAGSGRRPEDPHAQEEEADARPSPRRRGRRPRAPAAPACPAARRPRWRCRRRRARPWPDSARPWRLKWSAYPEPPANTHWRLRVKCRDSARMKAIANAAWMGTPMRAMRLTRPRCVAPTRTPVRANFDTIIGFGSRSRRPARRPVATVVSLMRRPSTSRGGLPPRIPGDDLGLADPEPRGRDAGRRNRSGVVDQRPDDLQVVEAAAHVRAHRGLPTGERDGIRGAAEAADPDHDARAAGDLGVGEEPRAERDDARPGRRDLNRGGTEGGLARPRLEEHRLTADRGREGRDPGEGALDARVRGELRDPESVAVADDAEGEVRGDAEHDRGGPDAQHGPAP